MIHPEASAVDVDAFLITVGWANVADDPVRIERVLEGDASSSHILLQYAFNPF